MKLSILSAAVLSFSAAGFAVGDEDLPAQINALRRERIDALTSLVEISTSEVRAGSMPSESLIAAETDLVNAQLEVADKSEERIALLSKALERERELLLMFQAAEGLNTRHILWWRSVSLQTQIRLAKERNESPTEIAQLRKKRAAALAKLVAVIEPQYKIGVTWGEAVIAAQDALVSAQIAATEKQAERAAAANASVERAAKFLESAESRFKAGTVTKCDVDAARSHLFDSKIRLLREERPNNAAAAEIQADRKEQIETLSELVKLLEKRFRSGTADQDAVICAETALLDARLSAADTAAARILVLKEAIERETALLTTTEDRFKMKTVTEADLTRARSRLLDTRIRLLRERVAAGPTAR
jgi:outer membrane protein TolC